MKKYMRLIISAAALLTLFAAAGCTSKLADPLDFNAMRYKYDVIEGEDGAYVLLTEHIISESDVIIPDSIYDVPVKAIGKRVFAGDSGIKSVTLSSSVKSLDDFAFADCISLTEVRYGRGLQDIGDGVFTGCLKLNSFLLSEDVTPSDALITLGQGAFAGCAMLGSTDFASRVDEVGGYAFQGCSSLTRFNMSDNVTAIGRGAFFECINLSEINIPKGISNVGGLAFEGTPWLKAMCAKKEFVTIGDGVLIKYDGKAKTPELPSSIKHIAGAFAGNTKIEGVIINKKAVDVGDMAFYGCSSLKTVDLPSGVTSIGSMAFAGCGKLANVYIPEKTESIAADAFKHCYKAKLYVAKDSKALSFCMENKLEYEIDD